MILILNITELRPEMAPISIDPVIAPLAATFCRQADALLDLRECAMQGTRPGRCVACYFALQDAAAEKAIAALCPLRQWLESRIEVVAFDPAEKALERLPLNLQAGGLEEYCRDVMAEFLENRAYAASRIQLEFRYKDVPSERAA